MLLWATQGITKPGSRHSFRTVPSAGARYPLDTYLLINRVNDIPGGIYRYSPFKHQLAPTLIGEHYTNLITHAALDQTMVSFSAVTFLWVAVIQRARWKYQQRAYRYIYLDAGHLCQNLYLTCEVLQLGCCAIAAFDDDAINRILELDGKEEFVIYMATVGIPETPSNKF